MRLFAGVFPPLAVRRDVLATCADLPAMEGLRLGPAENLHFTVAFFGERPASAVDPLSRALELAAGEVGVFRARIGGLSGFPASDRARVIFLGLSDGTGPMSTLHDGLLLHLPDDLRPDESGGFRPHLTLSRPRRPLAHGQFEALQTQARPWSWDFTVDALTLVHSETAAGGARYSVLAACGLAG